MRGLPAQTKPVVATPVFSPPAGTYHKPQQIEISDTTPGATIYHALHGGDPGPSTTKYVGPIAVNSGETIKAVGILRDYTNSTVAVAAYKIDLPTAAKPAISPPGGHYDAIQPVTITDSTAGATIHYTTDGSPPSAQSAIYRSPIAVSGKETIRAIATETDYNPSQPAEASYDVVLPVAKPVFHPGSGSYSSALSVRITDATPGAIIYYTMDGSKPSTDSKPYKGPIKLPFSARVQTLNAIAAETGFSDSPVATAIYTITPLVATPAFNPATGTYSGPVSVTITDSTRDAKIFYTTNGTPPALSSTKYSGPVDVTASETIQAIAAVGANISGRGSATYTITDGVTAPATISTTPAQNGALVVSLHSNSAGAQIYYTLDGSEPTTSSSQYLAPFLVASNITVKTLAVSAGAANSPVTEQSFDLNIPSGALVWSEEFSNSTGANAQPDPHLWTYDTGTDCCGNNEWEDYCAWDSSAAPCDPANPNAYVGTDGYLHIIARHPIAGTPAAGNYTSARLKTQGLLSFQYGRFEVRAKIPEGQGLWPAIWLLGNNITAVSWPACGELDVMEHINGSDPQNEGFDWVQGSIHGTGMNNGIQYHPPGFSAADWHTYGMIWTKGQIQYYVDSPANVYATFTPSTQSGRWPFDSGPEFVILNLAVGGDWPGAPNSASPFPSEFLVDYVRVYTD